MKEHKDYLGSPNVVVSCLVMTYALSCLVILLQDWLALLGFVQATNMRFVKTRWVMEGIEHIGSRIG